MSVDAAHLKTQTKALTKATGAGEAELMVDHASELLSASVRMARRLACRSAGDEIGLPVGANGNVQHH